MSQINEISLRRGLAALVQNISGNDSLEALPSGKPRPGFWKVGFSLPWVHIWSPHPTSQAIMRVQYSVQKNLSPGVKGKMHVCGRE